MKKFGYWEIIGPIKRPKHDKYNLAVLARCRCGKKKFVNIANIKSGKSKSCGCKPRTYKTPTRHGMSNSSTYRSWVGLLQRCNNKRNKNFKRYGARGIKVCNRWFKFDNFLQDMGEKPKGFTIERVNNNGNYEKQNCIWIPKSHQANNRRTCQYYYLDGVKLNVTQLAKKLGITRDALYNRIRRKSKLFKLQKTP